MSSTQGSKLIKNSVVTLFNTFFMLMSSWVISIWIARSLGPANYGIFNLVLWLTGTVTWALGMGLIHAITKFIAEYSGKGERLSLRPIVFYVLKIEVTVTVFTTAVLLFFKSQIADYFFTPSESILFMLAFLGLLPGIITAIFSAVIEGIQKFEYFAYSNLFITPFSFGAKVLVLLLGKGIPGLLIVMLVFSVVNGIFYFIVLKKEGVFRGGPGRLAGDIKKRIQSYNKSVMAILVCDKIVWDKSENFFLGRFCNAKEIGFYNLGYNMAQRIISILPLTFWRVLFPAMSSYFGSGDRNKMVRLFFVSTRYLAFVSFPIGAAGAILAYPLIHYLYGHEYIGAQRILQIIFASSIFSSLSNPASAVLYGYEKQSFIYKYGAVLAILNLTLDILIIKPYGALGASICYGITTILGSVGGLIFTCKTMKLQYPIVSVCKIMFSTIMMGTVMEIIILRNAQLPGFILSFCCGAIVYLICSLVLGTFEQEDYVLLKNVKSVLPGKSKVVVDWLQSIILQFKNTQAVSEERPE